MSKFEEYLDQVESGEALSETAREAASDAMAFCLALHDALRENGYTGDDEPSIEFLEGTIDGLLGELAAASIFLSERSFQQVPKMLRVTGAKLDKENIVPNVVSSGFVRLANRIEATRVQQAQAAELLAAAQEETK